MPRSLRLHEEDIHMACLNVALFQVSTDVLGTSTDAQFRQGYCVIGHAGRLPLVCPFAGLPARLPALACLLARPRARPPARLNSQL